jgi:pyruvate kinase
MNTEKRTKIVATLGPASSDYDTIKHLIKVGVNIFRLNFSHGTEQDHRDRAEMIRKASKELKTEVSILADLQGPKIRVSKFKDTKVLLTEGQAFTLDSDLDKNAGDATQVGIDYKALPRDVTAGDTLLLDDGRIVFTVNHVQDNKIFCTVKVGGTLSNNKGINKLGGGLSAEALTDKDKIDMKTAIAIGADYIAISFPRTADDMDYARKLMQADGGKAGLVAKIERAEAMDVIDEIIMASMQ